MKIYKIRNKESGLFSTCTHDVRWVENGRSFTNLGFLKNHLNSFADFGERPSKLPSVYRNAEIVEFELVETSAIDMSNIKFELDKIVI